MKTFSLMVFLCLTGLSANSQCTTIIESTLDYQVHIELTNVLINAPTSCPNGYNYTVSIDYNIFFTGPASPSSLWTLQGDIDCDNPNLSFGLPNGGGTGTATSANAYRNMTDCAIATSSLLNCNNIDLLIQGPGITTQTVTCALGIVPITLSKFAVEQLGNEVQISWETETETNSDFFTVERALDSKLWQEVAIVESAGFSNDKKRYAVLDNSPLLGTSYYRLKQNDLDGQFSYSELLSLKVNANNLSSFKIYPNPVNDRVYIERYNDRTLSIDVFDAIGNRITSGLIITEYGSMTRINTSTLASGIYIVRVGKENVKIYKH